MKWISTETDVMQKCDNLIKYVTIFVDAGLYFLIVAMVSEKLHF